MTIHQPRRVGQCVQQLRWYDVVSLPFSSFAAVIAARGTYLSSCAITRDSAAVNWHHVRLKAMVNLDSAVIKAAYLLSRLPDQMACPAAQE